MYFNNLGCINFHLRRHNLGVFNFRKALQENENVVREMRRSSDLQGRQHGGEHGRAVKPYNRVDLYSTICVQKLLYKPCSLCFLCSIRS